MGLIIDMIPHLVLAALLAILIRTVSRQRPVITRNGRPLRYRPFCHVKYHRIVLLTIQKTSGHTPSNWQWFQVPAASMAAVQLV